MFKVTKKQLEESRHEWEYKDGDNFTDILPRKRMYTRNTTTRI